MNLKIEFNTESSFRHVHVSGTEVMNLSMPQTEIPDVETTYMCTSFTFSDDVVAGDFHAVGIETIVDNVDILHHILVYGCPDEAGMRMGVCRCRCQQNTNCIFLR